MQSFFIWITVATVALLLLEIACGRHRGAYRRGDFPLLLGSFLLGRNVIAPLAVAAHAWMFATLLPAQWRGALTETPFWLAFPGVMLAGEFVFYWVHRMAHDPVRHPVLWKIHRTHHSGAHMNVTLKYRLNLFWFFIIPVGWVNGLALYLGLTHGVIAYLILLQVWNLVTHSHFRWDDPIRRHRLAGPLFRALEHVFVSPGIHHTHHGYGGRNGASYRNFCTILSLYDWLFGTLRIPDGRPARYGLPGHDVHWLEELLYPLVRMKKKERAAQAQPAAPAHS